MRVMIRRRTSTTRGALIFLGQALLVTLFVVEFGRNLIGVIQVNTRLAQLRDETAALQARADALTAERVLLDDAAFLELVARGYSLGSTVERPFVLAADAAPLPDDAPGSGARRFSPDAPTRSPLDAWLDLLLGS
jgi:cell division protein FtsB